MTNLNLDQGNTRDHGPWAEQNVPQQLTVQSHDFFEELDARYALNGEREARQELPSKITISQIADVFHEVLNIWDGCLHRNPSAFSIPMAPSRNLHFFDTKRREMHTSLCDVIDAWGSLNAADSALAREFVDIFLAGTFAQLQSEDLYAKIFRLAHDAGISTVYVGMGCIVLPNRYGTVAQRIVGNEIREQFYRSSEVLVPSFMLVPVDHTDNTFLLPEHLTSMALHALQGIRREVRAERAVL